MNKGKMKEYTKKYREIHKEKIKAYQKQYWMKHGKEINAKRRNRKAYKYRNEKAIEYMKHYIELETNEPVIAEFKEVIKILEGRLK